MKFFRVLSDSVYVFEKFLVNMLLGIMMVSIIGGVLFRYVFESPLIWSDEVAIYTLVWVTFIGGSMSIKAQQSVAVTILTDKLSGMLKKVVISVGIAICTLFSAYLLYLSVLWILDPTIDYQKSDAMQLPMIYPYLSVPVGILFMTVHFIYLLLASFQDSEQTIDEKVIL